MYIVIFLKFKDILNSETSSPYSFRKKRLWNISLFLSSECLGHKALLVLVLRLSPKADHTHIHVYGCTHAHTSVYIDVQTHAHTYHPRTWICRHTCTHTSMDVCIHTHTQTSVYMDTHVCACTHTRMQQRNYWESNFLASGLRWVGH